MNLDQFFTNPEIVDVCLTHINESINLNNIKLIIEPSAGTGNFYDKFNLIKSCDYIAFDIDKQKDYIIQKDFLSVNHLNFNKNQRLIIGNPPFGKRSKIAIQFLLHSLFLADIVCFIVPLSFRKYEVHNKIIKKYPTVKLISDIDLPPNSFIFNNKPYSVNCCFQIWTFQNINRDFSIRTKPDLTHPDFELFLHRNVDETLKYFNQEIYKWDFAVPRQGYQNYNRKEFNPDNMERNKQWLFFKANNKEILHRLLNLNFVELSKLNTQIPGFGKFDVINYYNKLYKL